jgi:hypothetical protein
MKRISKLNRAKVPQYSEGQIVLVKSEIPEQSSLFKIPYKGPYRIKNLGPRNVDLVDLESGREHTSYIEFLKPLSVKEFKLVLSKNWDLHLNHRKRIRNLQTESILDKADDPYTLGEILDIEKTRPSEVYSEENEYDDNTDSSDGTDETDPLEGPSTAYLNNSEDEKIPKEPLMLKREISMMNYTSSTVQSGKNSTVYSCGYENEKSPKITDDTSSTVQSEKNPTVYPCGYKNKKSPRITDDTSSTVQSGKNSAVYSCGYENEKSPKITDDTSSTVQSEKNPTVYPCGYENKKSPRITDDTSSTVQLGKNSTVYSCSYENEKSPKITDDTSSTVQLEKISTVYPSGYENKKSPRIKDDTSSTVQSEKIPTVYPCVYENKKLPRTTDDTSSTVQLEKISTVYPSGYENKEMPRDMNGTDSTVQSEKIPNKKIKNTSVNPLQLGREINKNEMDGTALLNNKIVEFISIPNRCVESPPILLSMKPVLGPGRQVDLVNSERESERLYKPDSGPTLRLCALDCPRPIPGLGTCISLIKGDLSLGSKDISEDESQTKEEMNTNRTSSNRKLKRVGFKSFMTRFFDPNK